MKKYIRVIFLLMVLSFIFYMSSQNAFKSNNYNVEVTKFLKVNLGIDLYNLFGNAYGDIIIRKLGHFFEFSLLTLAAFLLFSSFKVKWVTVLTIIFSILFAFVDEYHQLYVSGRSSSIVDVIIDTFGILMTIGAISLIRIVMYEIFKPGDKYYLRDDRSLL